MPYRTILNTCVERLGEFPPVQSVSPAIVSDAEQVEIIIDNAKIIFRTEIKGILKRPLPYHLFVKRAEKSERPLLLLAEYVNDSIASDLKKHGINFIDCAGNAFIHVPGKAYLEIRGKTNPRQKERQTSALFQPKGLRLLYILLVKKESLNQTVRQLAKISGISTGRVVQILKELREKGYIFKNNSGQFQFANTQKLFEQWLANYGDRLRPKLVLESFKILPTLVDKIPFMLKDAFSDSPADYAIGGSLGANILTSYYRGHTTEIYVRPAILTRLKETLKLMPARETDVTVFNLFSPYVIFESEKTGFSTAHPLFIYAELLHQGGSRERETAQIIYNTYLEQIFAKNGT